MANYEFEVTPTVNGGTVTWQLCLAGGKSCGLQANVDVGHAKNPSFKYTINDASGQFSFAPNPNPSAPNNDGPIWIQFGTKPTTKVVDSQITVPNGAGQKVLTFNDKNHDAGVLMYRLNFVDKQGNKSSLDPDITNGGHSFFSPAAILITAAVVAALVSAVITLVVAPIAARKAVKP